MLGKLDFTGDVKTGPFKGVFRALGRDAYRVKTPSSGAQRLYHFAGHR